MDIESLIIEEFKEDRELINVARYEQFYGINAEDLGKAVDSLERKGVLSGSLVVRNRNGKKSIGKRVKKVSLENATLLI